MPIPWSARRRVSRACGTKRIPYSIVGLDEGVVDGDNVDVVVLDTVQWRQLGSISKHGGVGRCSRIAEDNSANATEAVDSDLDDHCKMDMSVCVGKGVWWEERVCSGWRGI